MHNFRTVMIVLGIGFAVSMSLPAHGEEAVESAGPPDVIEIMKKNFMVGKLTDSESRMTMVLIDSRGIRRERKAESFSRLLPNGIGQERVAKFLSPPDVRGTATLTREHSGGDDDIWVYLPALKKVRRLVASNKRDSFMGSDFSYGDVITPRVEDWNHTLVKTEPCGEHNCYVVESTPVSEEVKRNTGYGKKIQWIRTDNYMTVKGEYADLAGRPLKEFGASDLFEADPKLGRWMAKSLRMKNLQTGGVTEISFDEIKVNVGVPEYTFSERYLKR